MIKSLHNIHKGATIAIVGSGPTAVEFIKSKCDISIGVNGAAKLGKKFDYFICGDVRSSTYDWFSIDCSKIRVIAKLTAAPDKILYPDVLFPTITRAAVVTAKQNNIVLPLPIEPHLTFMYKWYKSDRLKPDMNYLMFGGTISCCAVQLAYVMGATKIVLYGCGFNSIGKHYFYHTSKPGTISDSQRTVMSAVINELKKRGIQFENVGHTTLCI
jgi:uncharacterized Rossmann fold enzyme